MPGTGAAPASWYFGVRTKCKRDSWRLAGLQVHGENVILANNKKVIQAAAQVGGSPRGRLVKNHILSMHKLPR
jgi:hypothetical protein